MFQVFDMGNTLQGYRYKSKACEGRLNNSYSLASAGFATIAPGFSLRAF